MENASNALLMAAGILLSIMLISLGTFLFMTFGNYTKEINNNISQKEKQEFNAQFTKYETTPGDETTYCTPHDIVTVVNLAKQNNQKYGYEDTKLSEDYADDDSNVYICVYVGGYTFETKEEKDLNDFILENTRKDGELTKYTCNVTINSNTGLVRSVNFTQQK